MLPASHYQRRFIPYMVPLGHGCLEQGLLSFRLNGLRIGMGQRFKSVAAFLAFSALPVGWASAQNAAAQPQQPVPHQAVPQTVPVPYYPGQPGPAAVPAQPTPQATAPAPFVPPPLVWDPRDAEALLAFINQIGGEGLDPADYDPAGLEGALKTGSLAAISAAATERFNLLSSDLALGHVKKKDRIGWNVVDKDLDPERQYTLLYSALLQHDVPGMLRGLLPTHPQYRDLRNALSITPKTDTAKLNRIRLNMDRWRWLPRDLGNKYIIVNVPAFQVALVEHGATKWRRRAVAGAIKTPTPMLSVMATGVSLKASAASGAGAAVASMRPNNSTTSTSSVVARARARASPETSTNRNRCGNAKYSWSNRYPWNERAVTGSSASSSPNPTGRTCVAGRNSCHRVPVCPGTTRAPTAVPKHNSYNRFATSSLPVRKRTRRSMGS